MPPTVATAPAQQDKTTQAGAAPDATDGLSPWGFATAAMCLALSGSGPKAMLPWAFALVLLGDGFKVLGRWRNACVAGCVAMACYGGACDHAPHALRQAAAVAVLLAACFTHPRKFMCLGAAALGAIMLGVVAMVLAFAAMPVEQADFTIMMGALMLGAAAFMALMGRMHARPLPVGHVRIMRLACALGLLASAWARPGWPW